MEPLSELNIRILETIKVCHPFTDPKKMKLGKFSMSLSVTNLERSLAFYQLLGFHIIDGGHTNVHFRDTDDMKWRILENPSVTIGLFQGMFERNILTFHPGNILGIQKNLKDHGVDLLKEVKPMDLTKSMMVSDPDGNQILFEEISENN